MHGDGLGDGGGQNQTAPQIAEKGPNDFKYQGEYLLKRLQISNFSKTMSLIINVFRKNTRKKRISGVAMGVG